MHDTYREILENVKIFCNRVPRNGYEILYLERAERIYDYYLEAHLAVEEYEEVNPELLNKKLKEILEEIERILR